MMVTLSPEPFKTMNLIGSPFLKTFAKSYLNYFGNSNPSPKQLEEMQNLLSNKIKSPTCFDLGLTAQESECLYLFAQGRGLQEIAAFLNTSPGNVTQYKQSIFQKLHCKDISSAVIVAIRFGEFKGDRST
jgi:DNA-binding CsgD family transcriptional regulator